MAGQYVALIDGDDIWHPHKLRKCIDYLAARPQINVVYHPLAVVGHDGKPLRVHPRRCRQGWITEKIFHHTFIHDPSVVFHKSVLQECGPFDQSLPVCVGLDFWLRMSAKFPIGLVNEVLGHAGALIPT